MNDPATAAVIFVEQPEGLCGLRNRSTSTRVISASIVDREGISTMIGPARGERPRRLARLAVRLSLQPAGKRRGSAISHDLKAGRRHVMIRCAESGEAVPTGTRIDAATFRTSNLSDQTFKCPHCFQKHTWSKKDAWIEGVC